MKKTYQKPNSVCMEFAAEHLIAASHNETKRKGHAHRADRPEDWGDSHKSPIWDVDRLN